MNRIFIALVLGYFLMFLQSCNKEEMIDSSKITNYRWEVKNIQLSEGVDLNNDGVFSTNLLEELPCFRDSFYFGIEESVYLYTHNMILMYNTNDPIKCYNFSDCDNDGILSSLNHGSYEMINETKIKLIVTPYDPLFPPVEFSLDLVEEKLIRQSSISLPIDYDATNDCYNTVLISAVFEFEKY